MLEIERQRIPSRTSKSGADSQLSRNCAHPILAPRLYARMGAGAFANGPASDVPSSKRGLVRLHRLNAIGAVQLYQLVIDAK